jgi:hypothetical protein
MANPSLARKTCSFYSFDGCKKKERVPRVEKKGETEQIIKEIESLRDLHVIQMQFIY